MKPQDGAHKAGSKPLAGARAQPADRFTVVRDENVGAIRAHRSVAGLKRREHGAPVPFNAGHPIARFATTKVPGALGS
jgi:hypothetical protein